MRKLIQNETKNTIENLADIPNPETAITDQLFSTWASGGDASGRHSIYRSCKTDANGGEDNYNIILGGMRLISVHNEKNELIYEEKSLGPDTEYPHYLIPGSESDDLLRKIIDKYQNEIKDVQNNPIQIKVPTFKKVSLTYLLTF